MNKHLIALAVAAATLSGAASAAQVYSDDTSSLSVGGRVEARALLSEQNQTPAVKDVFKQETSNEVTDQSRARVNIDAKTQIADGVQGIGFMEQELTNDGNETRYVYAGVSSDQYGQIVYGKADGSLGMLTDFTDIMAYHGNLAGNKIAAADRTSNNLAYAGTFGDLTFKANYVFGGANGVNGQTTKDVHGFSTGAVYNVGDTGLALGAGYGEQKGALVKDGTEQLDTHKARSEQTFAVASYTVGDLYFAGLYKDGRRDTLNWDKEATDTTGYEAAVAYTMGKAVFTTTYNYLEDTNATHGQYDKLADAAMIDGTYYFNSNFRTYASYKFNMLDSDKVGKVAASDEFVLGARYDF